MKNLQSIKKTFGLYRELARLISVLPVYPENTYSDWNWKEIFIKSSDDINIVRQMVELKSGKLCEETFKKTYLNFDVLCGVGHKFHTEIRRLRKGDWCPRCNGNATIFIEDVRVFVEDKNGRLLSKEYKNNKTKLSIICNKRHIFKMSWDSLKNKDQWCPKCSPKGICKPHRAKSFLLKIAKNGKPRLNSFHPLYKRYISYMRKNSKCYDETFKQEILKNATHPSWRSVG